MARSTAMTTIRTLRIARSTNRLTEIAEMYVQGLGLEVLERFVDHQGFDGVILGAVGHSYQIEFTSKRGHVASAAPDEDSLLVFYVPDRREWETSCVQMLTAGFRRVTSFNPYWDVAGRTFEDADGYRVVLQNEAWT